jgi:hypothetical protein
MPAKAGIQFWRRSLLEQLLDSRLRGNDDKEVVGI